LLAIDSITPLTIAVTERGSVRRLVVTGELDLTTATTLQERAWGYLGDGHDVELDLAAVPVVDSSGLRALILIDRRAADAGARLTVLEPLPAQLRRLLDVSGVAGRLPMAPAPIGPEAR
jgi:anti-anti-sigma factor